MRFQSDDSLVIHNVAEVKMFRIAPQTKSGFSPAEKSNENLFGPTGF
jgi:hypothetical protein